MTFGVIFDFTGNSNASKVITAKDMIKQQWFIDALNFDQPIDLFLLIGHNPVRRTASTSTFGLLHDTIRAARPDTPIQAFGGHSHVRDFTVYDDMSTGLESGRYCETLGWLSMSGVNSTTYTGLREPRGVTNPSRPATNSSTSGLVYSRRYLDWNRLSFEYHAVNSQSSTFNYHSGLRVTGDITNIRKKLNLSTLYGCAPETYCVTCQPIGAPGNVNTLMPIALGAAVVNASRSTIPRIIVLNTGSIRFDLVKGPFTYDDAFIVSPFVNVFQFIPNVPYDIASKVLASLNSATTPDKRSSASTIFGSMDVRDSCVDPAIGIITGSTGKLKTRGVLRRQTTVTPGYITTDDFGTDGDDSPHSFIPSYTQPTYIQGNASFPATSVPTSVDIIFTDYLASTVVGVLNQLGGTYTISDVSYYIDKNYSTQNYLPDYAKKYWQANVPNCPVGQGVGFPS